MLTDTAIRNARPQERPFKVTDSGGLYLYVTPNGSKLWRLKYRKAGREKTFSIGAYPTISLADARLAREQAKKLIAQGGDPSAQKKVEKRSADGGDTFRAVANEYLDRLRADGKAKATVKKNAWVLDLACRDIGNRPIRDLRASDILTALRKVADAGHLETAHRMRTVIGSVFRLAVMMDYVPGDPTVALKGALAQRQRRHHAAITDPVTLGELMRAIDGYEGQAATRIALQLMAILAPRPGELRQARWAEFDLEAGVWTMPAARTKMRREHRVPLPGQAVELLIALKAISKGDLLFPSTWKPDQPMSENTLNTALRRLGYTRDEMTSHGFRSTFATLANESGLWHPDAIERALAHVEVKETRRAYVRGDHWEERVRMSQWWADWLDGLKAGRP